MSRRSAREAVYKLIFEYTFSKVKNPNTLAMLKSDAALTDEDKEYIDKTYLGVTDNFDTLYGIIGKYADGYAPERIYRPDLCALLLSTYELKYMPDVPASASINEAVEIVKRYSEEKSRSFVNGVLASINKEVRG
ncbi:MAG: transcription antitermination factor NusB [Clostridiaceae bacterium]|jgi:N utilization substance protein B|nr:transcription antitermination factor NusB [Clostridiaceae bacterium]